MGNEATQDVNQERRIILEEFFRRIWADGSFIHWVNPKTNKLNVKEVANKILKTRDTSIFSKWAQPYRDAFNVQYQEWRQVNDELIKSADATGQFAEVLETESPDAFLEEFLKSDIVKSLHQFDDNALKTVLNAYQALSFERFLAKIDQLKDLVKERETQISQKEKRLAILAGTIEYLKSAKVAEENHYVGSVRNIYGYDLDLCDIEEKP